VENDTPCPRPAALRLAIGACLIVLFGAPIWGCSDHPEMARVEGVVLIDDVPLTTGMIRFTPEAGRSATGNIQSDGTFKLTTFSSSDGAVVGNHRVSVTAYQTPSNIDFEVDKPRSQSLVPQYYGSPDSSGLTFEVKSGVTNRAKIELSSE
jgi:hypothetical protein